jgi:hypothetical protein
MTKLWAIVCSPTSPSQGADDGGYVCAPPLRTAVTPVIALAATGQLGMAAAAQIRPAVVMFLWFCLARHEDVLDPATVYGSSRPLGGCFHVPDQEPYA